MKNLRFGPSACIADDIFGGIAILSGLSRETVESSIVEAEWSSSNCNNWSYAVYLPNGTVAMIYHDGPGGFDTDPQVFELMDAADAACMSGDYFIHPDLLEDPCYEAA